MDAAHNLLGTSQITRATLAQLFTGDAGNRTTIIQLPTLSLTAELDYFRKVEEFLQSMNVSRDGNVIPVGAVSTSGSHESSRPGTGAATHGRRELACRTGKCGRGHDECVRVSWNALPASSVSLVAVATLKAPALMSRSALQMPLVLMIAVLGDICPRAVQEGRRSLCFTVQVPLLCAHLEPA